MNSRVADIIARARQSKAASSAKDLGSGTTTSSSNVQSQSAIAMVERNASNRTSKNTSKNADSDELEVEVSSSRVRVLPRSQNVPSTQSINNRAPLIPKSSSHTTNTTSGGRYSDVSKSTDSDA